MGRGGDKNGRKQQQIQSGITDTRDGSTIRNIYDLTDHPTESEQRDGDGKLKYRTLISYDVKNRVKSFTEATATETKKTEYSYDADDRVTEVKYNGSDSSKVSYTYDKLNRITNRTVTNGVPYSTAYSYVPGSSGYGANATTPLVQSITQGSGANALNFGYTYDSRGNITSETRNGVITTYEYDALGQLTRVNDPNDPTAYNEGGLSNNGTTWFYTYDRGGNILNKAAYEFTTGPVGTAVRTWLYEYNDSNWKDKLTKFDGHTITYDAIGNPLNDGTWTYVWQAGRQLKSMSKTESGNAVVMEFTYNHAGLRTKKVKKVNGTVRETTEYILNGKNVIELIHTDNMAGTTPTVNRLHFYYDAQDRVALVDFNGTKYSYAHNLQGDIIGILDASGNLVVEYKYDAWGKPVSMAGTLTTSLGKLNPFRYRGYVLDEETPLYYLLNRYYTTNNDRFINADIICINNMFAYSDNMPIVKKDSSGCLSEKTDVKLYLKNKGKHWMISIFGYVFSFGDSGFQIFEGKIEKEKIKGYSAYTVKNVPREEALKGVTYWLSLMVENFNADDFINEYANENMSPYLNELINQDPINPNGNVYDYEHYPCAHPVIYSSEAMGIYWDKILGSYRTEDYIDNPKFSKLFSNIDKSDYIISKVYLELISKKKKNYSYTDVCALLE